MFAPPANTNVDPSEDYLRAATHVGDRFPYCIPFGFAQGRSDIFQVRHRVFYCPTCEQGMEHALAQQTK